MSSSLRGKFLVASPRLRDKNFFRSVILIVENCGEGSMGLVINQPTEVSVSQALTGHFDHLAVEHDLVYCGGPVEPVALFVIHDCESLDPDETPVIPGVYMGSSPEVFEAIVSPKTDPPCAGCFRVYGGCAGWETGQLEEELERGDWHVIDADCKYVFHEDPFSIWEELSLKARRSRPLLPIKCDHPEWN